MFRNYSKWVTEASKRVLNLNYLFSQILVPLVVLSVYIFLSSTLFPIGVTKAFFVRFEKYLVPITILLLIFFLSILGIKGNKPNFLNASWDKPSVYDLLLLLLPLTPVVQYILINDDIVSVSESILIFFLFILLATIPIFFIPILLRRTGSVYPVMSLGLAFAFFITNMASMSKQFSWHEVGSFKIQLTIYGGMWFISWLMFQLNLRNLVRLFAAFLFVTNTVFQLFVRDSAQSVTDANGTGKPLVALIDSRKPAITPNIYLLVYDSYVVNETMSGYGIDNQLQEEYLDDLNFKIYQQTYSVGGTTLSSMSRVLNASINYYGNFWKAASGDGVVQNLLEGLGYETYGVFPSDFFFRGNPPGYSYSFPGHASSVDLLIEAIFVGEFRFDLDFDEISGTEYLQEKERLFSKVGDTPRFIYAHSELPGHSQISGICMPNEIELYNERLAKANLEMRHDIELIIQNDPGAIVMVAGDHGPHLTKNCSLTGGVYKITEISRLDIQDRFGAFLAIRWPSLAYEEYDDITVLQDLFQVIFAYLYKDTTLLEAKVEPVILDLEMISGATVINGVIEGGINNGEPLFTGMNRP